jgi:hypothetical protein
MSQEEKIRETLEGRARSAHASISWWKAEMESLVNESERWEDKPDHPKFHEKMDAIEKRMQYLFMKGEWENNNLEKLYHDINAFDDIQQKKGKLNVDQKKPHKG